MQWSISALIGAVPSTCIRKKMDSWKVAGWSCQWQALKKSGSFVCGEGLPCLQIRVTKALQLPLIVFSGSPHRSLDHLLTFHGSEGSSDVFHCTNKAEVVCKGRHFARAKHTNVLLPLQQFRCHLKLIPKPKGAYNGMGMCPWGVPYIGVAPILETLW